MNTRTPFLLYASLVSVALLAQNDPCFNEQRPMRLGSLMPYTLVTVGGHEGYFLVDFGTTASTIDPKGFKGGVPAPVAGTTDRFEPFDFFGGWGKVRLNVQDHSGVRGLGDLRQAGILGTDFLSLDRFMLDYTAGILWRGGADAACTDDALLARGFRAASTAGFYSNDLSKLRDGSTLNIPTVPVRIGTADAVAQIDPGFDDSKHPHAVNINRAFFELIARQGIVLVPDPGADLTLSTCVNGVSEPVKAYALPPAVTFAVIGENGAPIWVDATAHIFLKETPAEAAPCGGIGTWGTPAAQMGASFLRDAGQVIFDPFASKVWFRVK